MENNLKSPLSKYKSDISQELIDFTSSKDFQLFEKIIENLYLSRLEQMHSESEQDDIIVSQKILNIYANLPNLLKVMAGEVVSNRRDKSEQD